MADAAAQAEQGTVIAVVAAGGEQSLISGIADLIDPMAHCCLLCSCWGATADREGGAALGALHDRP
jgi:hypothetical protein